MPKETKEDETVYDNTNNLSYKSIEELKELLDEAIENENYEYASLIRDEIKQKENID
ncbi:MAG: UvrB/UvrC motif-containing protein [Bacteroidales bacterium]